MATIIMGEVKEPISKINCSGRNLSELIVSMNKIVQESFGEISIHRQQNDSNLDAETLEVFETLEANLCRLQYILGLIN